MVAGTATDSLLGICESLWRPDLVRPPALLLAPALARRPCTALPEDGCDCVPQQWER